MPDSEFNQKIEEATKLGAEKIRQDIENRGSEKESAREKFPEKKENLEGGREAVLKEIAKGGRVEFAGGLAGISNAQQARKQQIKEVEKILEEDLADIFVSLPPDKQAEFKRIGEKTTERIVGLLDKAKIKIGDIIKLIKKWLSIVPGVNKFFLEQESKIKADEIIKIKDNNR